MATRIRTLLDAVVIGAGAAGLAAARELSGAGLRLVVLEARSRIGGRILTVHDPGWPVPVELGAEFLHGPAPATRTIAEAAGLPVLQVPDRHWWKGSARARQPLDVWGELDAVRRRIPTKGTDLPFASFLESVRRLPASTRQRVRQLVEGYEAAPADEISAHSLALPPGEKANHAQARLRDGQDGLVRWQRAGLDPGRAPVHLGTVVESVSWGRGEVEVGARCGPDARARAWRARAVVVTAPLAVLAAASGPGAIRFAPSLGRRAAAITGLGMGHAVKITLRLRRPLWDEQTAFLHDPVAAIPTWWTQAPLHVPVLTGWIGGPRAQRVAGGGPEAVLRAAIASLGRLLGRNAGCEIEAWTAHDWTADPFSRGAYSFVRAGGLPARRLLSRPLGGTLFFAGEALDEEEAGTVNGALASGLRAARQVLRVLR